MVANIYSRPKLFITVFRSENLGLLAVTRTDSIWESTKQKLRKQDRKWQIENSRLHKAQTGQKTEKSSWYIKNYEGKEKKRCSIEEIYSFIMWKWFNTILENLSHQNRLLLLLYKPSYCHNVAILSDYIVADDGCHSVTDLSRLVHPVPAIPNHSSSYICKSTRL